MTEPTIEELRSPEFNLYLMARFPGTIEPDEQDFDQTAHGETEWEQAQRYRYAIARKMIRLCREWKAEWAEKSGKASRRRILARRS
jgi:hypothetical protein